MHIWLASCWLGLFWWLLCSSYSRRTNKKKDKQMLQFCHTQPCLKKLLNLNQNSLFLQHSDINDSIVQWLCFYGNSYNLLTLSTPKKPECCHCYKVMLFNHKAVQFSRTHNLHPLVNSPWIYTSTKWIYFHVSRDDLYSVIHIVDSFQNPQQPHKDQKLQLIRARWTF